MRMADTALEVPFVTVTHPTIYHTPRMIGNTIRRMLCATLTLLTFSNALLMTANSVGRDLFKLAAVVRRRLILAVAAQFLHSAAVLEVAARRQTEARSLRSHQRSGYTAALCCEPSICGTHYTVSQGFRRIFQALVETGATMSRISDALRRRLHRGPTAPNNERRLRMSNSNPVRTLA